PFENREESGTLKFKSESDLRRVLHPPLLRPGICNPLHTFSFGLAYMCGLPTITRVFSACWFGLPLATLRTRAGIFTPLEAFRKDVNNEKYSHAFIDRAAGAVTQHLQS